MPRRVAFSPHRLSFEKHERIFVEVLAGRER
jgi:hypothetical protein